MRRCVDVNARAKLNVISDVNSIAVQQDAIKVEKAILADGYVEPIVAPERWVDQ
jgi:hypothetical protein